MARSKEQLREMLKDQLGLLRGSLDAFYAGNFAESLRIATLLRVLVHESPSSKPLLKQLRPDGLEVAILDPFATWKLDDEVVMRFVVSLRLGPGPSVSPAVDLESSHYSVATLGSWWKRPVFEFATKIGRHAIYRRHELILMLANREGGAHVDPFEDPNYIRLTTDTPLKFEFEGKPVKYPDLARFLTAQSGLEMLQCLKRNFFPDYDIPSKWEHGVARASAHYIDLVSLTIPRVLSPFPKSKVRITRRP